MQEYWEAYMKPVDGHPAMISFNAGVSDNAPDMNFMYVSFVKVKLNNPQEDGLVNEEESNDVGFIEDRLEMELLRWKSGKYIGRIISQNEVNFIYYLKMDFEWSDTVTQAMSYFVNYTYEFGSRIDTDWDVYQKLLFPNLKEWQIITNHHACDQLKEEGDNLRLSRAIEHKAYFKTTKDRDNFSKSIEEKKFQEQKQMEVPFRDEIYYGVVFYRIDAPFYYEIDALTMMLIDEIQTYNGEYDGWECSLVKV
jgi:hypothetical protein